MRRIVVLAAVLCTAALAWSTPAVADPPGDNDTRACVTKKEFNSIENGDRKRFVHRTFDFSGVRVSKQGDIEVRQYKVCKSWRNEQGAHVRIVFQNGKVIDKLKSW
jgi:hypothetical protein